MLEKDAKYENYKGSREAILGRMKQIKDKEFSLAVLGGNVLEDIKDMCELMMEEANDKYRKLHVQQYNMLLATAYKYDRVFAGNQVLLEIVEENNLVVKEWVENDSEVKTILNDIILPI